MLRSEKLEADQRGWGSDFASNYVALVLKGGVREGVCGGLFGQLIGTGMG